MKSRLRSGLAAVMLGLAALAITVAVVSSIDAQAPALSPEEHFKYRVGRDRRRGRDPVLDLAGAAARLCGPVAEGSRVRVSALGLVWEEGRELPVGFAKKSLFGGERIAINCAFCHASVVRTSAGAPRTVVPAGPSNLTSPQDYLQFLESCAGSPEFTATNVLTAIEQAGGRLSWMERMTHRLLFVPTIRRTFARRSKENAWMRERPPWGPGRIDPFNPVKFRMLRLPVDKTIGNSDMVPIWNMQLRKGMAFHWDGLTTSLRESVLSSALGDGASLKSIDLPSLDRVEEFSFAPRLPAIRIRSIAALADKGKPVYDAQCAQCHAAGGARTGTVIPVAEVGTDRHRLDMWTEEAVTAYNAFADGYPWDLKAFRKTNGYVAVPLDGVWLRAPYLHNGSVPYSAGSARAGRTSSTDLLPRTTISTTRRVRGSWPMATKPHGWASATRRRFRATATPAICGASPSRRIRNARCWSTSRRSEH